MDSKTRAFWADLNGVLYENAENTEKTTTMSTSNIADFLRIDRRKCYAFMRNAARLGLTEKIGNRWAV